MSKNQRGETSQGSDRRSSRFVIEKNFQNRFTLKICMFAGGLVLVYGALVLFMIRLNYEMLISHALIQMPTSVDTLQREFRLYSVLLVLVLVLIIAFLYGIGLLLTQQIAGPLIAIQKRLRDFGDGHTSVRLRLRERDEFKTIETVFNYAMESHDGRQSRMQQGLEKSLVFLKTGNTKDAENMIESLVTEHKNLAAAQRSGKIKIPGEAAR